MITVALAEDCIEHQTLLKQYLNQNPNFKLAHIANNGIEMVQYCHSLHPIDLPNVIIADYQMNPMDGLQLTQYLTTTFNGLKVLALSSHDHLYPIENMFACGAMGFKNKFFLASLYQNKPIQKEWLQSFYDAITTVANGNYFIDEILLNASDSNGFSFKTHSPTLLQQQQNKFTQNIIYKLGITEREYQVFYLYC